MNRTALFAISIAACFTHIHAYDLKDIQEAAKIDPEHEVLIERALQAARQIEKDHIPGADESTAIEAAQKSLAALVELLGTDEARAAADEIGHNITAAYEKLKTLRETYDIKSQP